QSFEHFRERSDAVAGVDAIGIRDLAAVDLRIVVDVEDADGGGSEQVQAEEIGASLVKMIDVRQDAAAGFAAFGRDDPGFTEAAERLREAPDLRLRLDAH